MFLLAAGLQDYMKISLSRNKQNYSTSRLKEIWHFVVRIFDYFFFPFVFKCCLDSVMFVTFFLAQNHLYFFFFSVQLCFITHFLSAILVISTVNFIQWLYHILHGELALGFKFASLAAGFNIAITKLHKYSWCPL